MLHKSKRCIYKIVQHYCINIPLSARYVSSTLMATQRADTALSTTNPDSLFNKDLSQWNTDDVIAWLSSIDNGVYAQYAENFEEQKIDGLSIQYLTETDLKGLGIKLMGDRKHIMHGMNSLFKRYHIDTSINHEHESVVEQDENVAINIGGAVDGEHPLMTHDALNEEQNEQKKMELFHPDYTLPIIQLPQFENELSNISDSVLRIEYEVPWSIERFNEQFNSSISQLFLTAPQMSPSSSLSSFNYDVDHANNQLILYGNFIELSSFVKDLYELKECHTLNIPPRISHFLMDCGELPRIAKSFGVIPFIRNDGKLGIYRTNKQSKYEEKAIDAIKSLLKTLDCSQFYGSPNTAIIGTLLSMRETNSLLTTKLSRFGHIQYWNRGHSIFDTDYQSTRNIQRNNIYHLLLVKGSTPSNMDKMHTLIHEWIEQHSTRRSCDIGLVWFVSFQESLITELQEKHNVFIGACPHSKTIYVCGGTQEVREEILDEICNNSIYSNLAYCELSPTMQEYVYHCSSLSHFKPLKKLYNKEMKVRFIYKKSEKQTYVVTPSIFEAECNNFIKEVLEPAVLKRKTNEQSRILNEYMVLFSKIMDPNVFLMPHATMDESKEHLYIFHSKLADKECRSLVQREIHRYEQMPRHIIDVAAIYPWFRQYMHRILRYIVQQDSNTTLVTLLEDEKSIVVRCPSRIYKELRKRLNNAMNRVFAVPIFERLIWITLYERNSNMAILNPVGFLSHFHDEDGKLYIYHKDYLEIFQWVNKYFEIVLQIGLTYNQFPDDERILQRDCEFLLQLLSKFNIISDKISLFTYQYIVNFTLLMVYQCVLSTRYDLCKSLWQSILLLKIKDNLLIPNFLNIVFCKGGKEFSQSDMKAFLLDTKILFRSDMMEFIMKTLKENQQRQEMELLRNVLEDVHLDNDIPWSFQDIHWKV